MCLFNQNGSIGGEHGRLYYFELPDERKKKLKIEIERNKRNDWRKKHALLVQFSKFRQNLKILYILYKNLIILLIKKNASFVKKKI